MKPVKLYIQGAVRFANTLIHPTEREREAQRQIKVLANMLRYYVDVRQHDASMELLAIDDKTFNEIYDIVYDHQKGDSK